MIRELQEGTVRGFVHEPAGTPRGSLVLTHGAGGNARMPLLMAAAEAFAQAGLLVLRCDLPFRQKRPHGPPSPASAAADQAGLRDAVAIAKRLAPGKSALGGQSYGGRQATLLAAEDPAVTDALLLFSYPLHPPGKPAQQRTAHFPQLTLPAVFVSGSKDPFGSPEELRAAAQLIPGQTALAILENAGHDLARGKFDLANLAVEPLLALLR